MWIICKLAGDPMRIQGVKDSRVQVTRSKASALNTQDIQTSKALISDNNFIYIYTKPKNYRNILKKDFFLSGITYKKSCYEYFLDN